MEGQDGQKATYTGSIRFAYGGRPRHGCYLRLSRRLFLQGTGQTENWDTLQNIWDGL
jgi:hypothetical protein